MTVTALYTDIAGNISVANMRIENTDSADDEKLDAVINGNNAVVEEARVANTYYIGIRRDKQKGINKNIFVFMD